ncbi:amidohydrolase [uncultured Subdoligranulum sp.]|uniref:amidohydrolase n=1 Tax=uncultured Subdoligranulum sp. TaxID=512298 RepID=UPI0025EDB43B|nr:amidohydrolase family protein [uncultured Subdoligranulum sp.]
MQEKGEILFVNGRFPTLPAGTGGVWVRDGRVRAVLSRRDADALPAALPRVDLQGGVVLPGFNDSHLHLLDVGRGLDAIDLFGVRSPAELARRCADFLQSRRLPAGRAVYGNGWNQDLFEGSHALPTRADLDTLCPDHPLLLDRVCGHIMLCNTAALRAAGITRNTPDPPGGGIDHGPDGEPNGLLRDNAVELVRWLLPPETIDDCAEHWRAGLAHAAAHGLTSAQTCDVRSRDWPTVLAALEKLEAEGDLPVRLTLQCAIDTRAELQALWDAGYRPGAGGRRWKIGPLKLFLDGSLGARTAWLRRDYADAPGCRGLRCITLPAAMALASMADSAGMQVIAHAIGDAAMEEILAILQALAVRRPQDGPPNPLRHGVVHCQVTTPDQWDRLAALEAGALVQPIFLDYDHTIVTARCGPELAGTSYAFGDAVRRGIHVSYGTDAPVESLDPLRNLYCAVTRRPLAGGDPWQPEQAVSRSQALACYTQGSAWQEFAEQEKGRLAPGYLADFTVLDRDPLTVPEEDIPRLRVLATVVGGQFAYRAPGWGKG